MMLEYILLACSIALTLCQQPRVSVVEKHMPNGDESEIVPIDLTKLDGTENIKLMAQLGFHLNKSRVHVNGHAVPHRVVNSVRMRISVTEIKSGKTLTPRLAPVTFRVLVTEEEDEDGNKKLIAQFEFIKIDQDEVLQVDVKQIIWEGSNRKPVISISIKDSIIHHRPHEEDHHIFVPDPGFKPRLPSHGLRGDESGYDQQFPEKLRGHGYRRRHRHRHDHPRVLCWFRRLNIGGKIAVTCAAVFTFFGALASLIICWKRHFCRKDLNVEVPIDDFVEVETVGEKDDEKKDTDDVDVGDGHFHMELNACYVDVDDKKALVE